MQIFGSALGDDAAADARHAESLGFSGVRVLDHLFCAINGGPDVPFDHPFIALGVAAASTSKVLLTQTVLDVTRRHPVEVAQAIASLDRLSGGRAELGYGAGWYEPEHLAIGLHLGTGGQRVARFEEGLRICREMFDNNGMVDFVGEFFTAQVAVPWKPTPHRIPITVGVARPVMLRKAAAYADRLEILAPSPVGSDPGRPLDLATITSYMDTAREIAGARGATMAFSARVTVTMSGPVDESDPLALGGSHEAVMAGAEHLAGLGFSRLSILPLDDAAAEWLPGAVSALAAINTDTPVPVGAR